MKTQPPPISTPRLPEFAHELARRIARVRRWRGAVVHTTAGALAFTVVLAWLAGECALDFFFALPWWVRALGLLAALGGASRVVWQRGVCVARQQPTDDTVALLIERALPAFRSRFISAVQLARGTSTPLVRALVAETAALARTLRFTAVIDLRMMWRALGAATLVAMIGGALWFACGGNSAPLLRRAVLSTEPAPRRTKLHMLTGNRTIALGDDFKVEAGVSGIVPTGCRLHVKSTAGREQDLALTADPAHRTLFTRTLASVPKPFDYYVVLGDAHSETFHVNVRPEPSIVSSEVTQKFPAYTKSPPQRRTLGDLKLLAGSRLALHVQASVPIQAGAIRLVNGGRILSEAPLTPDAGDATQLAGEIAIPARDATGLTLRLIDAGGLESRATTVYRVEIVLDQPPVVKIRTPDRREELLTPGATMRLAFEAQDDFGLAKIRLHYAIDWTEGAPSPAVDLDVGSDLPREVVRSFDWKMAKLQPAVSEGQAIDYWLEALDANEPAGVGTMEHYQARIVSESEKRADLASRLGDTVKALNEVRQGELGVNAKVGEILAAPPADPGAPELLRASEAGQQQLAGSAQKLAGQLDATLGEYELNKLAGEDVEALKKMRASLARLATGEMQTVVDLLQKARAAGDPGAARKAAADADTRQKQIVEQIAQLIAEHGRQQEGLELSHALAQLADRQGANLQKAIESSRRTSTKKSESLAAAVQADFAAQTSEQEAIATELKSVTDRIAHFAKEPGHAEVSQRFQAAVAETQRVQPAVEAAAAMLKEEHLFKAAGEEKTARDVLRRLARQTAPPQSPVEALRIAEHELGKMMAAETAMAAEAQQPAVQDFESWLNQQAAGKDADKKFQRPLNELRANKALREEFERAKRAGVENLTVLENRQGDLAAKCDLLAQDLAVPAPNAVPPLRTAFDKMQDTRATFLDKAAPEAAQNAQAAFAQLEKARGEVAQLAMRAAAPAQPSAAANAPPVAQRSAVAERQAGELAKIIEAEQKLELETAKTIALAPPNPGALLKRLDVRQADLRARAGDVKAALAGDPADAVEALSEAGRDMSAAQAQFEKPDGPAADAAERKSLADLYRTLQALNQKIAQAGEQSGGNEASANAMAQTATQLAQAQATLAESQQDFQKVEAQRQAGEANAKAMQQAAAALTQAAQQAGQAAAEVRATDKTAQRAMQEAAQDAADGAAEAAAGRAATAQAKAGTAQARLAQAMIALAQAQAGLTASDASLPPGENPPPGAPKPGSEQATPAGTRAPAIPHPDFSGLPPRDRAALEQAQTEKYPAEYGPLIEQYLSNLARESTQK